MPRSVKRKRAEEDLKESLEEKRNMRRKEDDNSDVQKTSPTNESSAKSPKLKIKIFEKLPKLENALLAATNDKFKG